MRKKGDVLFLCQYFYPEYVSSATLPFDTAVALSESGLKVGALSGYPKEYFKSETKVPLKETHKGIKIKRLKYIQLKRSNFIGRLINYFSFTVSVILNFDEIIKYKSVIVYSNPPILPLVPTIAKKFFKTKMVFVSYDVYPEMAFATNATKEGSFISKIMNLVNKVVFNQVDKVVALSHEMKNYLVNNRNIASAQVEVIPNWYEDKAIHTEESFPSANTFNSLKKDGDLIVSYFGNMGVCQDLDTIVEAIRQVKSNSKIKFIFAGHGNKMDHLKNIVKSENMENVFVYDFLHGQDFQDALNISNCFLVSLAKGLKGLAVPSKTYSYMAAGKPVISIMDRESDIAEDLIENNAGYALEVGESQKLVNALEELLHDKDKRKRMGDNCRTVFASKYTKEHSTRKYVKMTQRLLGEQNYV
ncbi:glycosyltransferase family 4 protein [Halobacillus mangrovi]|uniref:Glycosyltransferase WbuB n=1 Tax=Halobacillus mangrovi TaxID=402384 RepID=A0A1W5ZSI1_9BACI|nr:glycosyltransferase family 4 protein [Halobacillus mangrovi]ARI76254.1 glycosyltransferase WbuB [Halobacillus mangrovi]